LRGVLVVGEGVGWDSRTWKIRLWGVVSMKRDVMPGGRGRGGRVVGSIAVVMVMGARVDGLSRLLSDLLPSMCLVE